jgi:hypothetical protein
MSSWIAPGGFFTEPDFDFGARIALGAAAAGVGDAGPVLATLDGIIDGDPQSWFDAWCAVAKDTAARGEAAVADGHLRTGRWALLAAAQYWAKALDMVDGLADQSVLLPTFTQHRRCWEGVVDAAEGCYVRVDIPFEPVPMPGWLLRPDASGAARPTLIMTNGSDGSLPSMLSYGASEALARGWNAFVFDGPGQQSLLFEHGVPFRHDWEAVLTPVIDVLSARDDVDAAALTGYGISQGGYWQIRALAFEHRLVAAVADPGVVDVSTSWFANIPKELVALLDSGDRDTFNKIMTAGMQENPGLARTLSFRARPYGLLDDPFALFTEVRKYTVADVVDTITTPVLVLDPEDEQFWPGQAQQVYDLLPGPKDIATFGRGQGANFHCQPLGRQLTNAVMFDWLEDRLRSV